MGIFQWMYGTDKPVKQYKEAPVKGAGLYFYLFTTYFWRLIGLNLLHVLFCLPIVTIPAATAASCRVYMKLIRNGYCLIFEEYWKEFKQQFLKRIIVFFALCLTPLSVFAYASIFGFSDVGMGLLITLALASFLIQCYLYPILALLDLPVSANLKNACILVFLEWKRSLLMLGTAGLWYVACFLFFPYTLPVILFFTFSAGQLMTCMCAHPAIMRRLVSTA